MSVAWWIVIAVVVVFLVSLVLVLIGRALPRKDDPEFAETATRAREGQDPGRD
jgi:hypothetical protein